MNRKHTLEDLQADLEQDPEFVKAYQHQKPYYDLALEIVRKRKSLGLTQKELAHRAGTKQSCISRIESGEHDMRLSTLINLAEAMDVRIDIHLASRLDESVYKHLFFQTTTCTAVHGREQEYTPVTIDQKVAETKA